MPSLKAGGSPGGCFVPDVVVNAPPSASPRGQGRRFGEREGLFYNGKGSPIGHYCCSFTLQKSKSLRLFWPARDK